MVIAIRRIGKPIFIRVRYDLPAWEFIVRFPTMWENGRDKMK